MKTRLALFVCFLVVIMVAFLVQRQFDYQAISAAGSNDSARLLHFKDAGSKGPRTLAVFSHGTNSHKEVFLPIALALALQGIDSLLIDSTILSTDDGLRQRSQEIAAIRSAYESSSGQPARFFAIGHSDGGPPSLEYMADAGDPTDGVIILGSQLSARIPAKLPTRGFVGGFDQIFPAADVIGDFARLIPPRDVLVSWLSDHFTEQYDPILISAISGVISGRQLYPWLAAACLALFAMAVIFALATGLAAGTPSGERSFYTWGFAMPLWLMLLSGHAHPLLQMPLPAAILVSFSLGISAGFVPSRRHLGIFAVFFMLMEINVVISTAFFRENLTAALPWLPAFLLWYPVAWVCKLALFAFSLTHRVVPDYLGGWQAAWLVLTLVPLIFRQGLAATVAGILCQVPEKQAISDPADSVEAGNSIGRGLNQKRLAVALLASMLILWVIRFSQGMVQAEIMQAVAGNFISTLLLPCCYLLYILFRRQHSGSNSK